VKYILDTNVVSAVMANEPWVVERLSGLARADVAIPQPVFAEIAYGIEHLPRSRRKDALRAQLELVRAEFVRALWSDEVSAAFGMIKAGLDRAGRRIEDFDAAIAAHALAVGAVLVTRNTRHMSRIRNLQIEDWSAAV
jgi:tRNA(fMet)-specific endonuclease VapC